MSENSADPSTVTVPPPAKGHEEEKKLNVFAKPFAPRETSKEATATTTPQPTRSVFPPQPRASPPHSAVAPMPGAVPPMLPGNLHIAPYGIPNFMAMRAIHPLAAAPPQLFPPAAQPSPQQLAAMLSAIGIPPSPTIPNMPAFPPTPGTPTSVSVGNAAFVAQRSQTAPKFACVLLVGVPGVGKTTLGKMLVDQLNQDNIGWGFFCGGEHIQEGPTKPTLWETTKMVLDALSETLDGLIKKCTASPTKEPPVRGLLIDKQCRGVEDLYYLSALLKSRGLILNGVVGIEASNEEIVRRMGSGVPETVLREKLKFHRVIQARIHDATKAIGLYHCIDGSGPKDQVLPLLRTMVLGCSSQHPPRQFSAANYHESSCTLSDKYLVYYHVLSTLFNLVKTNKAGQFPGLTNYVPLPKSVLEDRRKLSEYGVRRKVDGTKYLLLFDGTALFFVPRHMRCVFEVPTEAWLGVPLQTAGKFVLDGDLVKLTRERTKEKFVVYEVLYWGERGSSINLIAKANWGERQERLKVNLCNESTAFFPKKGEIVVVHQLTEELKFIPAILEPCDYPSDGIVFQSMTGRASDPVYLWKPTEAITVDFRLGQQKAEDGTLVAQPSLLTKSHSASNLSSPIPGLENSIHAHPQAPRCFVLEVFDAKQSKHIPYRNDSVEIPLLKGHTTVLEGVIVQCGMEIAEDKKVQWIFHRTRCDISVAAFKSYVDDLLQDCIIPKSALLTFAASEVSVRSGFGSALASGPAAPPALSPPTPPAAPHNAMTHASAAVPHVSHPTYASVAGGQQQPTLPHQPQPQTASPSQGTLPAQLRSDAQLLRGIGNFTVNVQAAQQPKILKPQDSNEALLQLQSLLKAPVSMVHITPDAPVQQPAEAHPPPAHREYTCADCHQKFPQDGGKYEQRTRRWYCFDCWRAIGYETCANCGTFGEGERQMSRRRIGDFFCLKCLETMDPSDVKLVRRKEFKGGEESRRRRGKNNTSPPPSTDGAQQPSQQEQQSTPQPQQETTPQPQTTPTPEAAPAPTAPREEPTPAPAAAAAAEGQ